MLLPGTVVDQLIRIERDVIWLYSYDKRGICVGQQSITDKHMEELKAKGVKVEVAGEVE